MKSAKRWLYRGTGVLVAGLLAANLATFALAHEGDPTLIHGCVSRATGQVRVVGPEESCRRVETALDWTEQGLTAVTVRADSGTALAEFNSSVDVFCLPGERRTGGGFDLRIPAGLQVVRNAPISGIFDGVNVEGWGILVSNPSAEDVTDVTVYAMCASS